MKNKPKNSLQTGVTAERAVGVTVLHEAVLTCDFYTVVVVSAVKTLSESPYRVFLLI